MLLAHQLWHQRGQQPEKTGPGRRPASETDRVLLLHGMGGTGALWRPIAAALEDTYEVLAPDQRGHGGSRVASVPGGRSPVGYAPLDSGQDLVETLDALDFHPVWVVGHSMGVRSACALAHLKPEWVRGAVLVDLGFSGVAGGGLGEGLAKFLRKLPDRFENRDAARTFMKTECPDPAIAQYLLAVSVRGASGELVFPFDRAALLETIASARDSSVRSWAEEMGRRGTPVLALRGGNSTVWSREEFEAERRVLSPYPSVQFEEFPGTGHGLPFEKRTEFVRRLLEFFEAGASK